MGPRSGQDQQSGVGTSQDPEIAPTHFQKDPGEGTVHDNLFAWEVKKSAPEQGKLTTKTGAALDPGHPGLGFYFPLLSDLSLSLCHYFILLLTLLFKDRCRTIPISLLSVYLSNKTCKAIWIPLAFAVLFWLQVSTNLGCCLLLRNGAWQWGIPIPHSGQLIFWFQLCSRVTGIIICLLTSVFACT